MVIDRKLVIRWRRTNLSVTPGPGTRPASIPWTMAISEATGQVVLTASGDQVAFVVFGVSLPF